MGTASEMNELLAAAERETGCSDWGDDWFRQPLAAWCNDLHAEHLNDAGRSFFRALAVHDLSRRLRVIDTLQRHPEIDDVEMPPIVYVAGAIRSGTTLFHNVMAQHSSAKPLLRWELMEPIPPPEAATAPSDPRIAAVQASIDKRRGTQLEAMHWVNADEPEECQWGFIDFVSLLAGAASGCMLEWGRWAVEADYSRVFENYRRVVKLLIWKNPPPPGGFLVLKAPQVTRHLDTFARVFPEAKFVAPVRDPYRVVASGRALVGGILDPFITDSYDPPDPMPIESIDETLQAMLEFDARSPGALTTVTYPELVADPSACAASTYAALGIDVDIGFHERVGEFLDAQRAGARVRPPRSLPDPGITHDEMLERPVVAAFCERFGVEPERSRLTGAHP